MANSIETILVLWHNHGPNARLMDEDVAPTLLSAMGDHGILADSCWLLENASGNAATEKQKNNIGEQCNGKFEFLETNDAQVLPGEGGNACGGQG